MFVLIKHRIIKIIEKIPLLQIFVYNNLQYFKFLFPQLIKGEILENRYKKNSVNIYFIQKNKKNL